MDAANGVREGVQGVVLHPDRQAAVSAHRHRRLVPPETAAQLRGRPSETKTLS